MKRNNNTGEELIARLETDRDIIVVHLTSFSVRYSQNAFRHTLPYSATAIYITSKHCNEAFMYIV